MNVYICIISGFLFLCASWYLESAKKRVQFIIDGTYVYLFDLSRSIYGSPFYILLI